MQDALVFPWAGAEFAEFPWILMLVTRTLAPYSRKYSNERVNAHYRHWEVMSSALYLVLLFSALWTLSFCGTRQFHVVNEYKTWTDAQNYCSGNFTDLATIESQEEMNALLSLVSGTAGLFWIGLRQKAQQSIAIWIWSDGSNSSYRYWNPGEPNGGVDLPLILINQNKTWREALRYRKENHVDLVSVHTEEIQHWVETAVYYASTANVWMGLRHTCARSFWFWVSGSTICYQNWAPGNGTGVEDCSGGERTGAMQSGSKQWVSLPEDQRLNFICTTSEGETKASVYYNSKEIHIRI
ncbi:hypothetical protein MHYP_G00014950 [Metynnis hypsauchen]